jgi:hypothetical protein
MSARSLKVRKSFGGGAATPISPTELFLVF